MTAMVNPFDYLLPVLLVCFLTAVLLTWPGGRPVRVAGLVVVVTVVVVATRRYLA